MHSHLPQQLLKPLLRGHFHQAAFFIALGACAMLLARTPLHSLGVALIYSLSLICMFGISALYHRPNWKPQARAMMKRFDHAAIFVLIAGTATPICWLALSDRVGSRLLAMIWTIAAIGIFQAVFWTRAPKWISIGLYMFCGWIAAPYIPEIAAALGETNLWLLLIGGLIYSVGAFIYALKRPDPIPRILGYHEIFHALVILAAILHFVVIMRLVN